jgi:NTP pyrophosphatase (non-canonical NTP hydrolase)
MDNLKILNQFASKIFEMNMLMGWYSDPKTGERIERNIPEMICLIHSELSEGLEGYRKNLMDDHLPHRPMLEVELADVLIRVFDLAGYQGLDLSGAFNDKVLFNASRADHKLENRALDNGKKF